MIGTLTINGVQKQIIRSSLYFDVFSYPLTRNELFQNSAIDSDRAAFEAEVDQLVAAGLLKEESGFLLSPNAHSRNIQKRTAGNKGAAHIMPTAMRYSRIISRFPFVEGICLSGGLSKNYYDEHGDIDYFIITTPGRLWICRSLLIACYKLLPRHLKKYWCTNYFIASDSLSLAEQNAFTATELAFLIPTYNYNAYRELLASNAWYADSFPNKRTADAVNCPPARKNGLRKLCEALFTGWGSWLDDRLLRVTLKRWQKKYPELNAVEFELQFRSRKNVCKRHTKGFQNKVLKSWEEKLRSFEDEFRISLG